MKEDTAKKYQIPVTNKLVKIAETDDVLTQNEAVKSKSYKTCSSYDMTLDSFF